MKRIVALAVLAASCLCLAAAARAADAPALTDPQFVMKASASDLAEVNLGKLAADRAAAADVKKFGQHMVMDHTMSSKEMLTLADRKKMPVAQQMDQEHQDATAKLAKLQGAEFDRAYMAMMVKDHEEAVALFTAKAADAKDEDLKAFAAKTLPTLKEHLQMARTIAGKLQ